MHTNLFLIGGYFVLLFSYHLHFDMTWVDDTLIHKTWISVLWTTRCVRSLNVFYILIKYLCDNKEVFCGIFYFAHIECSTGLAPKPEKSLRFTHWSRLHQKLWLSRYHKPWIFKVKLYLGNGKGKTPEANFFKLHMLHLWVWEKILAPISVTLGQGYKATEAGHNLPCPHDKVRTAHPIATKHSRYIPPHHAFYLIKFWSNCAKNF